MSTQSDETRLYQELSNALREKLEIAAWPDPQESASAIAHGISTKQLPRLESQGFSRANALRRGFAEAMQTIDESPSPEL